MERKGKIAELSRGRSENVKLSQRGLRVSAEEF